MQPQIPQVAEDPPRPACANPLIPTPLASQGLGAGGDELLPRFGEDFVLAEKRLTYSSR